MAYTMPSTFKIRLSGEAESVARTRLRAGKHRLLVDEPTARGGTDLAPSPLETFLAAFLACTNVITNIVAEEMEIAIAGMEFALTAHLDTRGVFNKAEVSVPFPLIELEVTIETTASAEKVETLRHAVARRCPISVILRQAGTRIEETWSIGHGG